MSISTARKWTAIGFLLLLLNTSYLWAFASATIFYMANAVAHLALGLVLCLGFVWLLRRDIQFRHGVGPAAGLLLLAVLAAAYLVRFGNTLDHRWVLWLHISGGLLGTLLLFRYVWQRAPAQSGGWRSFRKGFAACFAILLTLPAATAIYRKAFPDADGSIRNPSTAPTSMAGEGGGAQSPFFPSSAKTNVGGIIPANFFMDSEACGECHKDIYEQWKSSAHHFASFNNQFYRKSVEYMQSMVGPQLSKWCAGCHDNAVFFNGRFKRPIKEQIDTPEARAGLACT